MRLFLVLLLYYARPFFGSKNTDFSICYFISLLRPGGSQGSPLQKQFLKVESVLTLFLFWLTVQRQQWELLFWCVLAFFINSVCWRTWIWATGLFYTIILIDSAVAAIPCLLVSSFIKTTARECSIWTLCCFIFMCVSVCNSYINSFKWTLTLPWTL